MAENFPIYEKNRVYFSRVFGYLPHKSNLVDRAKRKSKQNSVTRRIQTVSNFFSEKTGMEQKSGFTHF